MDNHKVITWVTLTSIVSSFFWSGPFEVTPAQAAGVEFVFAAGLDRGQVEPSTTYGIVHNDGSPTAGLMEWQSTTKRTGDGAYHFIGGNVSEKALIGGMGTKNSIFGGLEQWVGGAYKFVSFQNPGLGDMMIVGTITTDGIQGADDKPVVTTTSDGKLRLRLSNDRFSFAETSAPLTLDRWYYVLLHARHGTNVTQELYLYDGETGTFLESLAFVGTTAGSRLTKLVKWGFGTSEDCTGLEFYLDDLFFSRGDVNPGSIRVVPKAPNSTASDGGFTPVGAPTNHEAVDEFPTDNDTSYAKNNAAATTQHQVEFGLTPATPAADDVVYAVQSMIIPRHIGSSVTVQTGVKVGSATSLANVPVNSSYRAQRVIHLTNPATGTAWTPAEVDTIQGVVRDNDTQAREFRVTNAWWDVVYRQTNVTPTLSVDLTATPSSGTAPLADVDLSADLSGTATGDATYQFDCTDDGIFDVESTVPDDPYTALDACDYDTAGSFIARVQVTRQAAVATDTVTITVDPPTLSASLTAYPATGIAQLPDVDLVADVFGTATGTIHYQFDCTDDGIFELDTTSETTPYNALDLCDYPTPGSYVARVSVERQGLVAGATAGILVEEPTLSVTLTADPTGGPEPVNGVDLTADVSGTASGDIRYQFDCTDDGLIDLDVTVPDDHFTAIDACDYPDDGTYTARVTVDRQTKTNTATATITVDPVPDLAVGLAADPATGIEPLAGVDLTADVAGRATGDIHYQFDCTDDGIFEIDVVRADDPFTATDACSYLLAGDYTARVNVERGGFTASATTLVTVNPLTLSVTLSANPFQGTEPLSGVDLTADVDGSAVGPIRYQFDCTDDGLVEVDVTVDTEPYTALDACNYDTAGTYTAKVTVERQARTATATASVTVDPPTLSVTLAADPAGGTAPLAGVDLTADVTGTATGDIRYRFDCENDGTFEVDTTVPDDPFVAVDACTYPVAGDYVASVTVDRQGLTATGSLILSVIPPTLSVSLSAVPTGGVEPLLDVDLTADVDGTATGDIRYRFDCTNDGIYEVDVTLPDDPYTAIDACDYATAGTYTAAVLADRQNVAAQATATITVTSATPKLAFLGSNGWTPGAEALINPIVSENPKAFIHTGDLDFAIGPFEEPTGPCSQWPELANYCQNGVSIHTEAERQAGYRAMMAPLLDQITPFYVAWGNHEKDGDQPPNQVQTYYRTTYGGDFGSQLYYAFDIETGAGLARVIIVDATAKALSEGTAQRLWLENELNATQSHAWRIVVGHTQPYTRFKPLPALTDFPYQLLSDKKVDLYLGGHPLAWERSKQLKFNASGTGYADVIDSDDSMQQGAGVVYVTVGGSGMHPYGTLYAPSPISARPWYKKLVGGWTYGLLEWSLDGKVLTLNGKGLPGDPASQYPTGPLQTFDTFTITQP